MSFSRACIGLQPLASTSSASFEPRQLPSSCQRLAAPFTSGRRRQGSSCSTSRRDAQPIEATAASLAWGFGLSTAPRPTPKPKQTAEAAQVASTSELGLGNRAGFAQSYVMGKHIGSGAYGIVNIVIDRTTGREYACKILPKARGKLSKEKTLKKLRQEIELLSRVQECENVVALQDVREDESFVYIITENCRGGDVEKMLEENGPVTERQAAFVLYECLKVIATCHTNNVIHGDVKPANFLMVQRVKDALCLIDSGCLATPWLKAIDFGCSQPFQGHLLSRRAGTPVYMAPEVFTREYGKEADCWSLGMMFYQLMTGRFPFWASVEDCRARTLEEVMTAVVTGDIPLDFGPWLDMSAEGLEFFARLTERNPAKRISAADALQHPWFQQHFCDSNHASLKGNIVTLAPSCTWVRQGEPHSPAVEARC